MRGRCLRRCLVLAVVGCLIAQAPAWAYTPHSPKVKAMVNKAVDLLESSPPDASQDGMLGGQCLIAMAIYKRGSRYGNPAAKEHPKVKKAVESVKTYLRGGRVSIDSSRNYSLGIATIFLLELDSDKYKPEIDALLKRILRTQRRDGSWSYQQHDTGDTSQTQYAVLAMWGAYYKKYDVPEEAVARVCNWLLRTQRSNGSWSYQGKDPGEGNYTRVSPNEAAGEFRITPSVWVAGLGSVYMAADVLGFVDRKEKKDNDGKPKALKKVADEGDKKRRAASSLVPSGVLAQTVKLGNQSFHGQFKIVTQHWQYYYLYGLERYESFREYAEGDTTKEPRWYNLGVDFLAQSQKGNGAWDDNRGDAGVNTAFAALFLLRSTQDSIQKTVKGDGLLVGGYGLPKDVSNLRAGADGKVVVPKAVADFEEIWNELNNEEFADLDNLLEGIKQISVDTTSPKRKQRIEKLRKMVSGESYKQRMVAVRALGRSRDLNNVPALIFAISDPDPRVMREARDALRFISRKFDGFGLPDNATPKGTSVLSNQERWKDWYLSIRPDANLDYLK